VNAEVALRVATEADAAAIRDIYAPHVEWFYAKVTSHQLASTAQGGVVKGYELTMSEGKRTREMATGEAGCPGD